jgi:soluble lytic murein transglycosylase-like protein
MLQTKPLISFCKAFCLATLLVTTLSATDIYDDIFVEAGKKYNVHPMLLKKIATIESGLNPKAICKNTNNTCDYGLMQINTIHLKRLKQYGISEANIMNPKVNIYVGSWILSETIKRNGFNFDAIGNYHSATPKYKEIWLSKLIKELKKEYTKKS